jgi:hypothetical protein
VAVAVGPREAGAEGLEEVVEDLAADLVPVRDLVFGQLAGAFYGEAGIRAEWRSRLALLGTIEELADRLHDAAQG